MPGRILADPAKKKLEDHQTREYQKRKRMVCYDSVIADFRTPGTPKNIEVTDFFGGSIIIFIDCLQKRMRNKTVLNLIRNGKLRELKDLVCDPDLVRDPAIGTFDKLDELEAPFYEFLTTRYEDEKISLFWKRFIHDLYEEIMTCAKSLPHLKTRSVDSVDELTAALRSLSLSRPTTHHRVHSSKHGEIYQNQDQKKKGGKSKRGKSKRVKRSNRSKRSKTRS